MQRALIENLVDIQPRPHQNLSHQGFNTGRLGSIGLVVRVDVPLGKSPGITALPSQWTTSTWWPSYIVFPVTVPAALIRLAEVRRISAAVMPIRT